MRALTLNTYYDTGYSDPESLLRAYWTMTEWCAALKRAGTESVAVVQRFSADGRIALDGVDYHFVRDMLPSRPRWGMRFTRTIASVRALDPDVVHVHGIPAVLPALRSALAADTALLWQHHGGPLPPAVLHPLYRRALGRLDAALFASRAQGEEWRRLGLLPAAVRIIDVPESSTRLAPTDQDEARRILGVDGEPLLLWIGRLDGNKDPVTVLRGFAAARSALPRARLCMLYTEAPLEHAVRAECASLGLGDAVRLVGPVPHEEIARWLSAADLFVLGSHREGCGFALIEALACGAWPVVTGIAPFAALTGGGAIGHLWQPGDDAGCARALREAAGTRGSRERVRAHFAETLSFDRIGTRARDAFEDAWLTRRRATRAETRG
ncbi:MAG: glycosyltransferase family 4 protein [Ignavibacteria bacterium]|nr:glycosyltransferase family 4 protein [Ignavibacteria bacterium]